MYVDKTLWKIVLFFESLMLTINWSSGTVTKLYIPGCSWNRQNSPLNPRPMEPDPIPPNGQPEIFYVISVVKQK